jgi:hypothetical protein
VRYTGQTVGVIAMEVVMETTNTDIIFVGGELDKMPYIQQKRVLKSKMKMHLIAIGCEELVN